MAYQRIRYEVVEDGIARIRLARPERLNAIDATMLGELADAIERVDHDPDVRVLLLTGAARPDGRPCFSAGVDLKAAQRDDAPGVAEGLELTNRLDDLPVPSIAAIDGICTTGASELALACDFRLVGEAAQVSDWHLKNLGTGLGGWGASTRWARLVGVARAKEVLLTGRVLSAEEAVRIGFASAAHPSAGLEAAALELARTIAGMDANGVALTLAHLDQVPDMSRDQALRFAQHVYRWFGVETSGEAFGRRSRALLGRRGRGDG